MFLDTDSKQIAIVANYLLSPILLYVPSTASQTGSDSASKHESTWRLCWWTWRYKVRSVFVCFVCLMGPVV